MGKQNGMLKRQSSQVKTSYYYLISRPPVAGIHGSEKDGCYSLVMSGTGEYADDLDWGEYFTYTGEGILFFFGYDSSFFTFGRDLSGTKNNSKNLRTAAQSKDQVLTKGNLALSRNYYNRKSGMGYLME